MRFPWLVDPKTGKKSVSLTLLISSFISLNLATFAEILGEIKSVGILFELFLTCAGLYFGRRLAFKRSKDETSISQE